MSALARLDFTTYNPRGRPKLLVEAKRVFHASEAWATSFRRNLFEYEPEGLAEVMLALVTPEWIFVWPEGAAPDVAPSHVLNARDHLGRYFDRAKISQDSVTPRAFERIVGWWLGDLTDPARAVLLSKEAKEELGRSGLLDALQGGDVVEGDSAPW